MRNGDTCDLKLRRELRRWLQGGGEWKEEGGEEGGGRREEGWRMRR